MSPGEWSLLAEGYGIGALLSGKTLAIVLWSGLGILTVSLLVLMRTRWGQARPLSKCIALSVFAHVLLMGYAYTTRLFDAPPIEQPQDAIHVRIVNATDAPREVPPPDQETPPWQRFAADEVLPPDAMDLARQSAAMDTTPLIDPVEDVPTEAPQAAIGPPSDGPAMDDPARPALEHSSQDATRIRQPGAAAILPDAPPEPQERAVGRPPIPQQNELPRQDAVVRTPVEPLGSEAPAPSDLLDFGGGVQQLADLAQPSTPAEALAAAEDRTRESNNLANNDGSGGDRDSGAQPPGGTLPEMVSVRSPDSIRDASELLAGPAPRRLGDGSPLPPLYRLRTPQQRLAVARQFGGDENTEAAVNAALTWLAANQNADGRWDADRFQGGTETRVAGHDRRGAGTDADTGITGLAVLAFLAAGETHLEGKYRETVQRGLEFLLRSQKADGNLAGSARLFAVMYCHGMASLALSEAYAMTGDHRLKPFVRRAAEYTIQAQHPTTGGWRYQPGDQGDMSQFGWQIMALKSAELAGLEIPRNTMAGSLRFLQSTSSGMHRGLAAYRTGERPSPTMTAEALVCRSFLNLPRNLAQENEAARYILRQQPNQGRLNLYLCYYGTLGLFQIQGDAWHQWQAALRPTLLTAQRRDGLQAGSWDPDTVWGSYGGRVYSTAMATLCLEVYYRYLPLYLKLQQHTP